MRSLNNIMIAALCAATISCTDLAPLEKDIADLKDQVAELQGKCEAMNGSIDALSVLVDALSKRDFVTSVQDISNNDGQGYIITFVYSPTVTIWIPSEVTTDEAPEIHAPVISVKLGEDGVYYWAADGEYVLDQDGRRVPVGTDGVTPELKIEDGKWYVSYDDGGSWEYLAEVPVQSAGGYVFSDIDMTDPSKVTLVLADGQKITLPVAVDGLLSLNVESDVPHVPGDVVSLMYSALKAVSVIVDDASVQSSEVAVTDDKNGEIRIQTRSDVPLVKQRAFLIFTIDGQTDQDWRLLSFDAAGKAVLSDIR